MHDGEEWEEARAHGGDPKHEHKSPRLHKMKLELGDSV